MTDQPDHDEDPEKVREEAEAALRAALAAFDTYPPEGTEIAEMLGALLAVAEHGIYVGVDRATLPLMHGGYMEVVLQMAGRDPEGASRGWMVLLNDRLNRTALELQEATEGNGRVFTDVAGPAMLVASNVFNVLNHHAVTEPMMRETLDTAERNLQAARRSLNRLRAFLRKEGFRL